MSSEVWLIIIGLVAGSLGGLLGVGGSVIMIPAMTELLGANQHLYQASAMIVNFFVAAPSAWRHVRAGAMLRPVVVWMAPSSVAAVLAGVRLSDMTVFRGHGQFYLIGLFGLLLLYAAGYNIQRLFAKHRRPPMSEADAAKIAWWRIVLLVGLPTGLVGGLLGVGGGLVAVPLQQRFLRMPLRQAIANSAVNIICLSMIGATLKNFELTRHHGIPLAESLRLAAFLAPTAIVGGLIGGTLTHVLRLGFVRFALIALLAVAGGQLLLRSYRGLRLVAPANAAFRMPHQ